MFYYTKTSNKLFKTAKLKAAKNKIVVNKDELGKYNMTNNNNKKGEDLETLIGRLCNSYLEGVETVLFAKKGSEMDVVLKADIAVCLEGGMSIPLQIKSSQAGAEKHLALNKITFAGEEVNVPSVIYKDNMPASNWHLLQVLSNGLELPIKEDVMASVTLVKVIKEKRISNVRGLIGPVALKILTDLNLVVKRGNDLLI